MILLIQIKMLRIFFFSGQKNRFFFTSTKTFAYNNQNVLNKTRFFASINSFL